LIVTSGPLIGRRIEVDRELTIGRGEATVDVQDDAVSRRHAVVRTVGEDLEIEDLGSRGGTWIEGQRIDRPRIVGDGTALRMGNTTFIVEVDAAAGTRAQTQTALPTLAAAPPVAAPALAAPAGAVPPAPYEAPPLARRRRRADTRLWGPAAASFAVILATAVALVLYFALR
jgi:predicted component of type VI protein secretion system